MKQDMVGSGGSCLTNPNSLKCRMEAEDLYDCFRRENDDVAVSTISGGARVALFSEKEQEQLKVGQHESFLTEEGFSAKDSKDAYHQRGGNYY